MDIRKSGLVLIIALVLLALVPCGVGLADKPEAEFAGGLLPSPPGDYPLLSSASTSSALPESIDLSAQMPPVRSQGSQASCVGWALAYYGRSYQEGIEGGYLPTEPSQLFSPAWVYNQRTTSDCSRDLGMTMIDGLRILVDRGAATLATTPYNTSDSCAQPSQEAIEEARSFKAASYAALFVGRGTANLAIIKAQLANRQPVVLAVPIYSEFYRVSRNNPIIDKPAADSSFYGGHALLLTGYDDATETFSCINSWGSAWAKDGYGYLTYDFVQDECWEGWVLRDQDTTAPDFSGKAFELGGSQSDVAQADVDSPIFAWQPSNDPSARYEVCWSTNANAQRGQIIDETYLKTSTVVDSAPRYLRGRAIDEAGNASPWRSLFVFRYQPLESELSLPPLASLDLAQAH